MGQMIGRFEIVKTLGRGAQGAVLLARDPRVERVVAIKIVQAAGAGEEVRARVLHEARAAGALRHPGIVQVYDVGEHGQTPYLVYEYVDAGTLAQRLKKHGPMPAQTAVPMMTRILDALEHAHGAGVVHRDLKPSNVLVGDDDHPRITDFGIAVRGAAANGEAGALIGTPRYMAPEYVTAGVVGPQNDVFAAGLILYEMLFGVPAFSGDSVFQVLHQVANQPVVMPKAALVDDELFGIVAKATARDPELRYASAAQMRKALAAYADGHADAGQPQATGGKSTLDFLLRRMNHKSDFPAMSAAIRTINRLAVSDQSNAAALANEILKDFALTNKILRLANSAFYRTQGGARVRTVSRAIVVLGFNAIRNLAVSLVLFEHIRDQQHATALKDEFLRSTLRGLVARELAARASDGSDEEIFVCALFRNLGRLLARYYFREEAELVARMVAMEHCSEDQAAQRALGVSYRELGMGVARSWGFPDSILASMGALPPGRQTPPQSRDDRLRLFSGCADSIVEVIEAGHGKPEPAQLAQALSGFSDALGIPTKLGTAVVQVSLDALHEQTRALGIAAETSAFLSVLHQVEPSEEVRDAAGCAVPSLPPESEAGSTRDPGDRDTTAILRGGIQDIGQALVDDTPPADVLRIIAEIIYRALPVRRVLICERARSGQRIAASFGFGESVDELMPAFRLPLGGSDIFNLILARNADVLVSDASVEKIRKHLPEWHLKHYSAQSFLVLPMRLNNQPVGLIYADVEHANALSITPENLSLLRTLREQARLALKQSRAT